MGVFLFFAFHGLFALVDRVLQVDIYSRTIVEKSTNS